MLVSRVARWSAFFAGIAVLLPVVAWAADAQLDQAKSTSSVIVGAVDFLLMFLPPLFTYLGQGYDWGLRSGWDLVNDKFKIGHDGDASTDKVREVLDATWNSVQPGEFVFVAIFLVSYFLYLGSHAYVTSGSIVLSQEMLDHPMILFQAALPIIFTTAMLSFVTLLVFRYVCYVRLLNFLSGLTERYNQSDDGLKVELGMLIKKMRKRVYREESWFEPPGNIFVTAGIAATFLGLASGLVTLDFDQLFHQLKNATETEGGDVARNALAGFIRYMGLGIGVSVIGVLVALGAQFLRGYVGPTATTEEILHDAEKVGNGKDAKVDLKTSLTELETAFEHLKSSLHAIGG